MVDKARGEQVSGPGQWVRQGAVGIVWAVVALVGWWFYSPQPEIAPQFKVNEIRPSGDASLQPLPELASLRLNSAKVALGERLFSDVRFSVDNSVSCSSCHNLANAGVDNMPRSVGAHGRMGVINTPTVFNSAFNFTQFWDGRAQTLEEQVDGPITSQNEFVSNWGEVLMKLGADSGLEAEFNKTYPDGGLNAANVRNAIAEFQRSLLAPSRFDRFLRGDTNALTESEKNGYAYFLSYGCAACHQGRNIGGNLFQKLGVARNYYAGKTVSQSDQGRYNVTHDINDMHVFKVPSLRNVARTAPYFHDANAQTLSEAITVMARYQLGVELPEEDRDAIEAFLKSLTGEYRGKSL